jgi:hypothetical protein
MRGGANFDQSFMLDDNFGSGGGLPLPGATDTEMETRLGRYVVSPRQGYPMGVSTMLRTICPYVEPTTGLDAGATLNRAAFGHVTCANDGVALTS